jgi:hypothetical protein
MGAEWGAYPDALDLLESTRGKNYQKPRACLIEPITESTIALLIT